MPKILENDAARLVQGLEQMTDAQRAASLDIIKRYKQQQDDDGEPFWPSVERARMERENNLRSMFEAPEKITYDPGPFSQNPQEAKMIHANMALLSARYQKEPAEVASRYDFLLNDYARQKLGASENVDTAKFYALAQKDMQRVKLREDTQREGMSAALRGEDGVKALAAWQAKNADRAKDDAGLFMRGYQQALEQDGEMLPIADRLLPLLEAQSTKKDGQAFDQAKAQELGGMIEQLAGMKKAQRKSVYRSIAARIEAAGYDQKGFWSQMLGFLDQQLYAAGSPLRETGGIAADVATAVAGAQTRIPDTFDGSSVSLPVLSDEEQQALLRQRDYRERIGEVEGEIMQIVSGELDPVRPTTGWMNETIETGFIKAPGAILPSMSASALLGPYGAGLLFTADFAANNRRELVQSGMDADQARKIAVMAAPVQAAVESLSNMVGLGKFPAVQAALSRFTRPVGGASLVGRYVQNKLIFGATEFTEEQVQANLIVPVIQEVLGVFETYMPEVDWDFYKTRAANTTPELAATLLPMALVFGGVMTAADAKLSRTTTQNVELLMGTGMDQAQAVEVASQPTQEQRIRKGAELWLQRKGTKASMEEAQKKLADQYRTLAADSAAAVKELEARGVLPRLLPMQGGEYRLTFNDGSTADFKTREEALGGVHVYIRDRMQRSTRALRETIDTLTKNLEQGREFALEISPEAMPADEAVKRGIISPQALQERAEQGAILDATTLIENSVLTGKALGDEEAPLMLFGMSKNEWYDKEGRAIGMQRIKDDILRTTMRLWDGASPLTLIEEKTEGDAKVILSTPGKRQWMLDHLRAYEDASGDKLFTSDDNEQINDKQLIEAWSHMAQSYFVAAKDKVKGRTLGRYLRDIEEAELTAAMQGRASWWQAVVNRAQKLGELKAAGKLGEDVVAELEKQLGIDSQVKHEQESLPVIQQVANEVAQQASDWVDDSQFDNLPPSGDTFSMASASGAAQANEPSPGGLSEAEAEIKNMLPTDVRADYQKFDDRAPILWRGETTFPAVRSVKIIGADSSGKSRSIYPSAAVTLANGGVFVKRFRVSDHAQVSETAFRQYDLDYRLTRDKNESEKSFDKRILQAAEADLISAARFAWDDQMKQLRPLVDANYAAALEQQKLQQSQKRSAELQRDDTMRFFRDDTMRPAKVYRNKFGWTYRDGILKDAQGRELGRFANLDAARFWIRDEYFKPSRAAGGTQETFSASRAIPADASKVVQMPDGARLVGPTTFSISSWDSKSVENAGNAAASRSASESKVLADFVKSPAFKAKGLSSLDIPSQRAVMLGVFRVGHDLQILDSIIELIPIDVMDVLRAEQLTPDMLFDNQAMFEKLFVPDGNGSIASGADSATALLRAVALGTAKSSARDFAGATIDNGSTNGAGEFHILKQTRNAADGQTFSLVAYHGTPHKVDKFTTAKIGTGEGAQAYGWGLYFAEVQKVAENYRFDERAISIRGESINSFISNMPSSLSKLAKDRGVSIEEARAEWDAMLPELRVANAIQSYQSPQSVETMLAGYPDALERFRTMQRNGEIQWGGNLYTVELLPDEGDFLDWDKPLSEQSEKVKAVLAKRWQDWISSSPLTLDNGASQEQVDAIQKSLGSAFYDFLAYDDNAESDSGNIKAASEYLASLGIPGIRYLDGGSRGAGDGTRNYVIFDENLVRILEENGKPVAQETFSLRVTPENPIANEIDGVSAKDIFASAKQKFGITRSVYEAGYVLPDGSMLDFSGRSQTSDFKQGADLVFRPVGGRDWMKDQRGIDHREIEWGGMPDYSEQWGAMVDFLRLGAVRVDGNSGMISMHSRAKITAAQASALKAIVVAADGAYLDLEDDAGNRASMSLESGKWGKVQGLLNRWAAGETPEYTGTTFSLRPGDFASRVEAMFSPFQRSPEARLVMARVAKDRALRVMPQLLELQAQFNDINRQRQDLETKFAEESAQLRADLEADEKQVRQERDFELKGVSQDNGSELDRERIRRAADNKLSRIRLEYERKVRELENRKQSESSKLDRKDNSAQREKIRQLLKLHDAILAAVPAKVRPSIGEFASVVKFTSNEQALAFLQKRMDRIDSVVEKYLITEARGQLERLFDKARPKSDAGEKAKGKLTPELHAWFKLAEEATKLSPAVADERIQGIEQSLASDMTDAIKQELSDWLGRPVTDDAEAQTWQETRLTLFQTFGAVMYGTDAKSERNAAEITAALDAAREAYQTGRLAHIEQLAKLREKRAEERGDGIQRVGSPYDPNKANTRKKALNKATGLKGRALDYMDTGLDASGFFLDLLGADKDTDLYENTRRNILEAEMAKDDAVRQRKADFDAMLRTAFPGKGKIARLRGLWELQQIQENAPVGTMSQLQAMQFTLWHLDPDSREWLATNGYGDEWQAKAEQWLTSEAKAVRAWLLKQYDGQYDRLNPVFRRLRGVNLPRVEVYGGKRQIEHSKSDSTASIEADMMRGGMDAGFTKTRVSRPTGRPRMTDALVNYWQNALQVEHYIAFAETVTELKAVFGHRDFLGAVETNRGLDKKQQVLDWINNLEQAGNRDAFAHTMVGRYFGRYGKAVSASALLLKIAVFAKQAPAMIQSAFKIGLKEYFISLSRIMGGNGAISLGDMYHSATVQRRLSEHDDEMIQASKGWNQRHFENEIIDKTAIASDVVMNAGWYSIGWTDARFTTISAAVAYDVAFRDGKKLGMADDEAKAFAEAQADLIVMETAQPQNVATKSLFENMSPSVFLRMVFAFQSANRQVFGLTYLAAKQGKVANAYAVAALIAGLTQTIGGIMRMMFSDDDPEELFDPQAYALGMATAPVTGMVGFGPLVELVLNFAGVESRFSPSSAAAAKSLQDIINGEADTKDVGKVVSMAGAALGGRGAMLGVGWNVLNQIMGLYENVTANE